MARGTPLVSVIVPTYGRSERQFRAAIDSVRAQTYDRIELVVVDDSPDGVGEWIGSEAPFERVRLLSGSGSGPAAARNRGIRDSEGVFLAFLDDDDRWRPSKLTRQVGRMRADDAVGVVLTGIERVRNGQPVSYTEPPDTRDATRAILTGEPFPPFSAAMVRRRDAERAGPIDDRLQYLEDREWYLRLAHDCAFARVPAPLVSYRLGEYDRLTRDYEAVRHSIARYRRKHRGTAQAHGVESAFHAALARNLTTSALAAGAYDEARAAARRAVRAAPTDRRSHAYLLAALGGRWSYRLVRTVNRTTSRLERWLARRRPGAGE